MKNFVFDGISLVFTFISSYILTNLGLELYQQKGLPATILGIIGVFLISRLITKIFFGGFINIFFLSVRPGIYQKDKPEDLLDAKRYKSVITFPIRWATYIGATLPLLTNHVFEQEVMLFAASMMLALLVPLVISQYHDVKHQGLTVLIKPKELFFATVFSNSFGVVFGFISAYLFVRFLIL